MEKPACAQSSKPHILQNGTPSVNTTSISKLLRLSWSNNLFFSLSNTVSVNWLFLLTSQFPSSIDDQWLKHSMPSSTLLFLISSIVK